MSSLQEDRAATRLLRLTGWIGLLGATLVGIGEFTMQFAPHAAYGSPDYAYFASISRTRLAWGHFLSVLAAPLYLVGYWHLGLVFRLGGSRLVGWLLTILGGYSLVVANAWLGGRIYLALLVHRQAEVSDPTTTELLRQLLVAFRAHNEPLINVPRALLLGLSVLWIWRVARGYTLYPRWMAAFNPALVLGSIFLTYLALPAAGVWLVPAAMNVTHVAIFGLSLLVVRSPPDLSPGGLPRAPALN